jgi:hypothetical protein
MSKRLVVYTAQSTERLQYVLQFVFTEVLQLPYVLVQQQSMIMQGDCCLSYAHTPINFALHMPPAALLFETDIKPQDLRKQAGDLPKIFAHEGAMGFDVFAAVFYVLTRYEEYLPYTRDDYGRYSYKQSIVHELGVLHLAIVNRWIWHLFKVLKSAYPELPNCAANSNILHTYDIDMAFSIQARSRQHVWASVGRSFSKFRFGEAVQKLKVYQGYDKDAFDCFDRIQQMHTGGEAIFFFLLAEQNSKYNRNNLPSDHTMQQLIEDTSKVITCGIHPSYEASLLPILIELEKSLLQAHCHHHVSDARFHYIRQQLPSSYQALLKYGIRQDYSCGYGSTNGFRAGTAQAHYWFDLASNTTTALRIQPFAWMDANCHYEHRYSATEAEASYDAVLNEVQTYGGTHTPIWHNFMIGDAKEFASYKALWQKKVKP